MHTAISDGQDKHVIRLLIANGANINAKDKFGRTPIYEAIVGFIWKTKREDIIKILIESGADLNTKDNEGETPLAVAIKGKHKKVVKLLRENGAI